MAFRIKSSAVKTGALGAAAAAVLIATPLVKDFEGRSLFAYLDPVRIPTICDGIIEINGKPVKMGDVATEKDCDRLLESELIYRMESVDRMVIIPLHDYTLAALGSFTYNIGLSAFRESTALKLFNAGNPAAGCEQLLRWTKAKGRVLAGLVRRRQAERDLCLLGVMALEAKTKPI